MIEYEEDENIYCPRCGSIMKCHGCTGYNNINNIPAEQDASYYSCPRCGWVTND